MGLDAVHMYVSFFQHDISNACSSDNRPLEYHVYWNECTMRDMKRGNSKVLWSVSCAARDIKGYCYVLQL
jgi:hypothetical protein